MHHASEPTRLRRYRLARLLWGILLTLASCNQAPLPSTATPMAVLANGPTATLHQLHAPVVLNPADASIPDVTNTSTPDGRATSTPVAVHAPVVLNPASATETATTTSGPAVAPTVPALAATPTFDINAPLVLNSVQLVTTTLTVAGQTLVVELASTFEQREIGLMNRDMLDPQMGMLFVFPNDQQLSFWMRNTRIPLSIAFADADGRILNIADMEAYDETTIHNSNGPARYALEVNQGWFAQYGVKAGDMLTFSLPDDLEIR